MKFTLDLDALERKTLLDLVDYQIRQLENFGKLTSEKIRCVHLKKVHKQLTEGGGG